MKVAGQRSKTGHKDPVVCTYCKKPRHTREKCWKLHGRSSNFQNAQTNRKNWTTKNGPAKGQGQSYVTKMKPREETNSFQDYAELDRVEIEKLKFFLGTLEKPTGSSTCSLAFSGNISQSFTLVSQIYPQQDLG